MFEDSRDCQVFGEFCWVLRINRREGKRDEEIRERKEKKLLECGGWC